VCVFVLSLVFDASFLKEVEAGFFHYQKKKLQLVTSFS